MSDAYRKLEQRLREEQARGSDDDQRSPAADGRSPGDHARAHGDNREHEHHPPQTAYVPLPSRPSSAQQPDRKQTNAAPYTPPSTPTSPSDREHKPAHKQEHKPEEKHKHEPEARRYAQPPGSYILSDDRDHPLHRIYRKRIRGIRARWLGSGLVVGIFTGILLTMLASALVVKTFPSALPGISGDPDLAVVLSENFLNKASADRLQGGYPAGVGNLKVTALSIDLRPDARMFLRANFSAKIFDMTLDFNAGVENDLTVQDGKLVFSMVGDPQLGDLAVPLEMLPFNLKDSVRSAVDRIDNEMLASEINDAVGTAASNSDYVMEGLSTTETALTIRLRQR